MKLMYSRGYTCNIGNYEFARFDISIEEECDQLSNLDDLRKWVMEECKKELERIEAEIKVRKSGMK